MQTPGIPGHLPTADCMALARTAPELGRVGSDAEVAYSIPAELLKRFAAWLTCVPPHTLCLCVCVC